MMDELTFPEQQLVSIITCQVAVLAMDRLRGTPMYRQEVKKTGNMFLRSIEGYTSEQMSKVFGEDDDTLYKIMDFYEGLFRRVVGLRPEGAEVVSALIDEYRNDPEGVIERLRAACTEGQEA